jgi:hypothetical protein
VSRKPNELQVLDHEIGNFIPAKEQECNNIVSQQVKQIPNELQVLDHETGNLVPAQEKECKNVEQPLDGESTIGPCMVSNDNAIRQFLTQDRQLLTRWGQP